MITQTLWLTQLEFDTLITKSKHIDTNWHKQNMVIAQELRIKPCLGDALYDEITNQIATNTLTVANNNLREQFAQALAYYTVVEALQNGWSSRHMPIGTIRNTDTSSDTLNNYEIAALKASTEARADQFKSIAVKWLHTNSALFPLLPKHLCGHNSCKNPGTYSPFYYMRNRPSPFKCWPFRCGNRIHADNYDLNDQIDGCC